MLFAVDELIDNILSELTVASESAVLADDSPLLTRARAFGIDVPTPATLKAVLDLVKKKRVSALAEWAETMRGPQTRPSRWKL